MGIRLFGKSQSRYDTHCRVINNTVVVEKVIPGNPNPLNYDILRSKQVGKNVVMEVLYPDCKNYEGRKILVFANTTIRKITDQGILDPHFSENKKYISPFARFEPTNVGWKMANKLITHL